MSGSLARLSLASSGVEGSAMSLEWTDEDAEWHGECAREWALDGASNDAIRRDYQLHLGQTLLVSELRLESYYVGYYYDDDWGERGGYDATCSYHLEPPILCRVVNTPWSPGLLGQGDCEVRGPEWRVQPPPGIESRLSPEDRRDLEERREQGWGGSFTVVAPAYEYGEQLGHGHGWHLLNATEATTPKSGRILTLLEIHGHQDLREQFRVERNEWVKTLVEIDSGYRNLDQLGARIAQLNVTAAHCGALPVVSADVAPNLARHGLRALGFLLDPHWPRIAPMRQLVTQLARGADDRGPIAELLARRQPDRQQDPGR